MKFDMNRAWREAAEMVAANREVLLIVAGLFFFLPSLAFALFVPAPTPSSGMTPEAAMAVLTQFYSANWPWFLLMAVAQTIGFLTVLALLRDQAKPTVGEALKRAVTGILPYLAAQILAALAIVVVASVFIGAASATGLGPLIALVVIAALVAMVYVMIKISLTPAVIAIERQNNPIAILRRSWTLTKGNSFRLFLFFALLFLVVGIAALVIGGAFGVLFALFGSGTASQVGESAISGLIGAVATVYFVAILAAIHRQLAGPSPEAISRTFG
jgi:hypothetical protein